jgi:hypothetical protein
VFMLQSDSVILQSSGQKKDFGKKLVYIVNTCW